LAQAVAGRTAEGSAHAPSRAPRSGFVHKTFHSLENPDYRLLWVGFIGGWMAMQMQQVARGYLAYELTGSAFWLGMVTLAMGLPRMVLSPLGGVLADRYPKRTIMFWSNAFMSLTAMALAYLVWRHEITIWWLIVLGFLQGIGFSVNTPVRQALIPVTVGNEQEMANAIALNNAGVNMTRLVGPSIAGVLIAIPFVGLTGVFFIIGLCYVYVMLTVLRFRVVGAPVGAGGKRMSQDMVSGFRYLFASPALLALMGLGFIPLAIGLPYQNLMPVFALNTLNIGATGLGVLLTVVGLGGLAGSLAIAHESERGGKAALQGYLGVAFGLALVAFTVSAALHFMPGVILALLIVGFCGDSYMALNSTMVMQQTDRAMYGRVMGAYFVLQSVRQLSVVPIGAVADDIGAPLTIGLAGALTAAFVFAVARFYPKYREIG
jgi:MFS family permease